MFKVTKIAEYNETGNVVRTHVTLTQLEPYTLIPAIIEKDLREVSDDEIERLALDDFYNRVFPNRAENEQFQLLKQTNKEQNETIKQAQGAMLELSRISYENRDELDLLYYQLEMLAKSVKFELPTELPEVDEATEQPKETSGDDKHVEEHENVAN